MNKRCFYIILYKLFRSGYFLQIYYNYILKKKFPCHSKEADFFYQKPAVLTTFERLAMAFLIPKCLRNEEIADALR